MRLVSTTLHHLSMGLGFNRKGLARFRVPLCLNALRTGRFASLRAYCVARHVRRVLMHSAVSCIPNGSRRHGWLLDP